MERWRWIVGLLDPSFLLAVAAGAGIPLLLIPAPIGPLLGAAVAGALVAFNVRVERSVSELPAHNGAEAVLGRHAVVEEPLSPNGLVRCGGEAWRAEEVRGRFADRGERVVVKGVQGLTLRVERGE